MSALDRLKMIQAEFKSSWVGINTDYSGKPGTSILCNTTRIFKVHRATVEEDERAARLMKIFSTLRNIEHDYPLLVSTGNDRQSRTA